MKTLKLLPFSASSEIKQDFNNLIFEEVEDWLKAKNIIPMASALIAYQDLTNWYRSGAESYLTKFRVKYSFINQIIEKQLVVKAAITLNPGKSILIWKDRRRHLEVNGVRVSNWMWSGNGIIIEDYYPYSYKYAKIQELVFIAYKLDVLGFSTFNFLEDLRCGIDKLPYYTDFGFDLGDHSLERTHNAQNTLLKTFPGKQKSIKLLINEISKL